MAFLVPEWLLFVFKHWTSGIFRKEAEFLPLLNENQRQAFFSGYPWCGGTRWQREPSQAQKQRRLPGWTAVNQGSSVLTELLGCDCHGRKTAGWALGDPWQKAVTASVLGTTEAAQGHASQETPPRSKGCVFHSLEGRVQGAAGQGAWQGRAGG